MIARIIGIVLVTVVLAGLYLVTESPQDNTNIAPAVSDTTNDNAFKDLKIN